MTRRLSDKRRKKLDPERIRPKLPESRFEQYNILFEEPPKFKVDTRHLRTLMAHSLVLPGLKQKMTDAEKGELLHAVKNCNPSSSLVRHYLRMVSQNKQIPKRIRAEALNRLPKPTERS